MTTAPVRRARPAPKAADTTLHGTLERVVFRNADTHYTVARLLPSSRPKRGKPKLVTIVGTLPGVRPGEDLELEGEWHIHPTHGATFRVRHYQVAPPTSREALVKYLASGVVKGLGQARAQAIVDHFGEATLQVIADAPERLAEVPGIGPAKIQAVAQALIEQAGIKRVMGFLQEHACDASLAAKIYRRYGEDAIAAIQTNPYQLEQDIHGIGFVIADQLGRSLGVAEQAPERLACGLKHALGQASEDGHTFLPQTALFNKAARLLGCHPNALVEPLRDLQRRRQVITEPPRELTGPDEPGVYLTPLFLAESGVVRRLRALCQAPSALDGPLDVAAALAAFEHGSGLHLAAQQREAIQVALSAKVSVLTGGPGTGKTTTLRALIATLERHAISYCLAAPTGRAARRLSEVTGRPASTLHRLLDYAPDRSRFGRDEANPLPARCVVVDEVSMLDVLLANHLLKAVEQGSHLLLVGDADQLPSVGPGDVLRELIAAERVPVTNLTELFRQARASQIVVNAHRVNQGHDRLLLNRPDGDFFLVRAEEPEAVAQQIVELVTTRLPRKYGFDAWQDLQVLAPIYAGAAGVAELNRLLQERMNPPQVGVAELSHYGRVLRVGDKVMQTRNDYDKNVFNGDLGRIAAIDRQAQTLTVEFPGEPEPQAVPYEFWQLDALTLAYALTVHRAQGSEYPVVVMPVLTQHYPTLGRNLLYTAITRARRLCVLVGTEGALFVATRRKGRDTRHSGLALRLRESLTQTRRGREQLGFWAGA